MLQEQIDNISKLIKTDSYPMSIGEISNIYLDGDITINPEYQRQFRWDISQKSKLIESILLGIPVPPIYVYQTSDGVWDVIDGQQRLSTILQFMNFLKKEDESKYYPEPLIGTKFLPSLEGIWWDADCENPDIETEGEKIYLTEAQRRFIKRSKLEIIIIDKTSDKFAQYEMFQRLNTGGSHLSPQEIRNCILIMNDRNVYNIFNKMSRNQDFIDTLPISEKDQDEQGYLEFIVRYFILRYSTLNVKDSENINEFLTDEIIYIIENNIINYDEEIKIFNKLFKKLNDVLGEGAFKKFNFSKEKFEGPVSVASYESIIPGLAEKINNEEVSEEYINDVIKNIYSNEEFIKASRRGTRPISRLKRLKDLSFKVFESEN